MIFYNPRKPGGKFHFRFYMLCCATSYACIRLRMHTRNNSDLADAPTSPTPVMRGRQQSNIPSRDAKRTITFTDEPRAGPKTTGLEDDEITDDEEQNGELSAKKAAGSVMLSLIMDMCEPLSGSGRVVNMDNYYTSPKAAWMLAQEKVYMRGTCRTNRIGFPSGISFSSKEKNNWDRGSMRGMIERRKGIAAFGWLDGNPVHFLTTADGNGDTEVKRRVGRERMSVRAPIGILQYNKGMQAVDRHDQLREGFSLSARHGFKKYYQKIALGLIDMAVVNAWIHYKLVNPEKCTHERARYEFMDSMADSFLEINWQVYYQNVMSGETVDILRLLTKDNRLERKRKRMDCEDESRPVGLVTTNELGMTPRCTPIAVQQLMSGKRSKKKGLSCQICSFEGRGVNIISHVAVCGQHRVRACTIFRESRPLKNGDGEEIADYSWRANIPGASCWDKLHKFYIPNGLFRDKLHPLAEDGKMIFQCCRVGSKLYAQKKEALGEATLIRGRRRERDVADAQEAEREEDNVTDEEDIDIEMHAI